MGVIFAEDENRNFIFKAASDSSQNIISVRKELLN